MIKDRVNKLAMDIRTAYHGQTVHLMCVLKGGTSFFQDLIHALRQFHDYNSDGTSYVPYTIDFIRAKSYAGTSSSGEVRITDHDMTELAGKHVLLVEDII
eukprot:14810-Heterococcus_DN1.PRE.1